MDRIMSIVESTRWNEDRFGRGGVGARMLLLEEVVDFELCTAGDDDSASVLGVLGADESLDEEEEALDESRLGTVV